jgi:hypothetical protein
MQIYKTLRFAIVMWLLFAAQCILMDFSAFAQSEQAINFLAPDRAKVTDSKKISWGGQHSAGLHKCSVKGEVIICWFVITNLESGRGHDYDNGD